MALLTADVQEPFLLLVAVVIFLSDYAVAGIFKRIFVLILFKNCLLI